MNIKYSPAAVGVDGICIHTLHSTTMPERATTMMKWGLRLSNKQSLFLVPRLDVDSQCRKGNGMVCV